MARISSLFHAKMETMRTVVLFAQEVAAGSVEFKGNAQVVLTASKMDEANDTSLLGHMMNDARHFLHTLNQIKHTYTIRQTNKVIYKVVRL
ncbi:hypothetical protein D8674_025971 [Pyrus ussuriensis x Pyrus communis]|uniref:RNase H type-1 domain-containing protein n=1 Tax=Pyrus ussuriensis x Pyrus communis TaxID=2448454 RepID=A0A5N5I8A8_9ROSA|nr:hypothetical protein D8674_025971 [Pyrus ussuriensis x Pyrus communis]